MSKDGGQRHPLEPKQVGKGVDAPRHRPLDPQTWLIGSNHPYSPFPGNALKWESWVWDDGTTYEHAFHAQIIVSSTCSEA